MAGEAEQLTPSDLQLVEQIRTKEDHNAFAELVVRYRERVLAQVGSVLGSGDWSHNHDLSQEVWVKVWKALSSKDSTKIFQGVNAEGRSVSFGTWLTQITINACKDFLRQKKKDAATQSLDEMTESKGDGEWTPTTGENPLDSLLQGERASILRQALSQLKPEQRQVLELSFLEQLEYKEIAKRVGCGIGTVMSRCFYAKKALAKQVRLLMAPVATRINEKK